MRDSGTAFARVSSVERRLTGDACVEALLRAGFRIRSRGTGIAILVRGASLVMIPNVTTIEKEMLQAILRSAGITRTELDLHLAHVPTRSGFFAKHQPADGTAPAASKGSRRG
jgi:hypothetical protein